MKWNRAELLFALALLLAAPGAARAQGTAPGGPDIMTCAYNSSLPSIVAGTAGFVQCDAQGRLIISNPGSGGGSSTGPTATSAAAPVGTSATQIAAPGTYVTRSYVNSGTAPVYVGGSGVTVASGYPVQPGQSFDFSHLSGAFYGIAASATQAGSLIQY